MNTKFSPPTPYVRPSFNDADIGALDPGLSERVRRPMIIGAWVVGVFVFGALLLAAVTPIDAAVVAPGVVKVEASRKAVQHRDGGVVRKVLVREGQQVKLGEPLIMMDDVQAKSFVDVLQNQYDAVLAQSSRYQAEASGQRALATPAELAARVSDPRVANQLRDLSVVRSFGTAGLRI